MKNILNNKYFLIGIALVVGLLIGRLFTNNEAAEIDHAHEDEAEQMAEVWTCSMHPQIRRPGPGDCPICGMDLIPLAQDNDNQGPAEAVQMSPTAMQLAQIVTEKVGAEKSEKNIRLSGKIQENEQLLYVQTAHFGGRIEQLLIDFEGEYVQKGQVVANLYAPQLQTAQQELLEAKAIEATQPALLKAAKQKLRNWKLTEAQITSILENKKVQEVFPLKADHAGYVKQLNVKKGDYIEKGKALYQLANLSQVWVMLDVYEADLAFVSIGDEVTIKVASFPAKEWKAKVSYVDPVINPNTRVANARVILANPNQQLKPEMLVTAQVMAQIKGDNSEGKINVPKSAVLWTGKRSVVYVKEQNEQSVYFSMREVTLGQSLGDRFIIEEGLSAGEEIASHGAFSIDAAAQLAGKPSMMSNSQQQAIQLEGKAKGALQELTQHYLALKNALVEDDFTSAQKANALMFKLLEELPMSAFSEEAHQQWMPIQKDLKRASEAIKEASDIAAGRKFFIALSIKMIEMVKSFELSSDTLYVQHCPMADSNNGADWISTAAEIKNPYFGDAMLSCGEVVEVLKN